MKTQKEITEFTKSVTEYKTAHQVILWLVQNHLMELPKDETVEELAKTFAFSSNQIDMFNLLKGIK